MLNIVFQRLKTNFQFVKFICNTWFVTLKRAWFIRLFLNLQNLTFVLPLKVRRRPMMLKGDVFNFCC